MPDVGRNSERCQWCPTLTRCQEVEPSPSVQYRIIGIRSAATVCGQESLCRVAARNHINLKGHEIGIWTTQPVLAYRCSSPRALQRSSPTRNGQPNALYIGMPLHYCLFVGSDVVVTVRDCEKSPGVEWSLFGRNLAILLGHNNLVPYNLRSGIHVVRAPLRLKLEPGVVD